MPGTHWTESDTDALLAVVRETPRAGPTALHAQLVAAGVEHYTHNAVHSKLKALGIDSAVDRVAWAAEQSHEEQIAEHRPDLARVELDKKEGVFNWRDANKVIRAMQDLSQEANQAQYHTTFGVPDATEPIFVLGLCDTHIGDYSTSHEALERITDEILNTPGLYVVLLGDLTQLAIKMRSVAEVMSNLLTPELQMRYLDSWLADIAPKVICATWSNHEAEREERQTGISMYRHLLSKRVPYSDGIAHVDIKVGPEQVYRLALSHVFRGKSMFNPAHGAGRYLRFDDYQNCEIAMAGDSHTPGFLQWVERGRTLLGINGGSIQASGYMKRYFSLINSPYYPGVALYPDQHRFQPFWSVGDFLAATRARQAPEPVEKTS